MRNGNTEPVQPPLKTRKATKAMKPEKEEKTPPSAFATPLQKGYMF